MKDRIRHIMEEQHMSQQVFADFIGLSPATLSSIFNGRTRPTLNIVEAIKNKLPSISTDWLLMGVGDMYVDPSGQSGNAVDTDRQSTLEPMIDFDQSSNDRPAASFQQGVKNTHPDNPAQIVKIIDKE